MLDILEETLHILHESAVYLIAGFALSGLLHVFLGRASRITRMLTGRGPKPVLFAALLGAPMPLCSCSVLPAALTLRRQGASRGTTASFLVSVPETDIVSILLTYGLLGPLMAIYRPVAALVMAVATGLALDLTGPRDGVADEPAPAGPAEAGPQASHGPVAKEPARTAPTRGWLFRALHYGFVEFFDDVSLQLLLGIVVAGAIAALLPRLGLDPLTGNAALSYLVMLVVGVPMYVCASASTPIAVGFIAGGVSPGAALVFLLAGPATNVASLVVLGRTFRRGGMIVYLASIALLSVAFGLGLDAVLGSGLEAAVEPELEAEGTTPLLVAGTVILLALFLVSFLRKARRATRG